MAGGRAAAENGAGACQGTEELRDPGKRKQLRPELRQVVGAMKTNEAQAAQKQLQVACLVFLSLLSQACMLVCWLCNRSQSQRQQFPELRLSCFPRVSDPFGKSSARRLTHVNAASIFGAFLTLKGDVP